MDTMRLELEISDDIIDKLYTLSGVLGIEMEDMCNMFIVDGLLKHESKDYE